MAAAKQKSPQMEQADDNTALILYRMDEMQKSIDRLETKFDNNNFASQTDQVKLEARVTTLESVNRNTPIVEKVVFVLVGLILLGFFSAIALLVYPKGGV